MVKKGIILGVFLIAPFLVYATDEYDGYEASGFGTTAVNVPYCDTGATINGYKLYMSTTSLYMYRRSADTKYAVFDNDLNETAFYYYTDRNQCGGNIYDGCTWHNDYEATGDAPVGDVVDYEDCVGSSTPSSLLATTSELTYGDWLFSSSLQTFLLSFIGIGILFSVFRQKR